MPAVPSGGVEQWRELVCSAPFVWDCGWALRVIGCESGGNPNAVGTEWYEGQLWYFVGLWQIATLNEAMTPVLKDPVRNTAEADYKYRHGGVGHWPVCGSDRISSLGTEGSDGSS